MFLTTFLSHQVIRFATGGPELLANTTATALLLDLNTTARHLLLTTNKQGLWRFTSLPDYERFSASPYIFVARKKKHRDD